MVINKGENYPVFVELSPEDVMQLSAQNWDTLRVLILPELDEIAVASGYGNTHTSMCFWLKRYFGVKIIDADDSIIYFRGKTAYCNGLRSGRERIPASRWEKVYGDKADLIRLLCEERGLNLN